MALGGILLGVALAGAYALFARTPALAFDVGGVGYRVERPEGYCLPEGEAAEAAERINAADADHRTVLFLVRCPRDARPGAQDYTRIITPRALEYERVPKPMVLERLGGPGEVDLAEIARKAGEAIGADLVLEGEPHALGHDGDCAYQGLVATVQAKAGGRALSYRQAAGTCFTVIGGQVLAVTRYGTGVRPGDVATLLAEARALALAIRVER